MAFDLLKIIYNLLREFYLWLISEKSAGVLTITTGLIAWLVYRHQVRKRENEAAIILLNEIRNAEKAIDEIKNGADIYNDLISILPTCSWDKNYQIFAHYLDRDSFELLATFFKNCKSAQQELIRLRSFLVDIAMKEKARIVQNKLFELSEKYKDKQVVKDGKIDISSEYAKEKKVILDIFYIENEWFIPHKPRQDFLTYINNIQKITSTMVAEKIKKMARE
jgi:hypothetical protein